jgi:ankyrin repeat protein
METEVTTEATTHNNQAAINQLQAQIEAIAAKLRLESVLLDANSILLKYTKLWLDGKLTEAQVQAAYQEELQAMRDDHIANFHDLVKQRGAVFKAGETVLLTPEQIPLEVASFTKSLDEYLSVRGKTLPQPLTKQAMQTLHTTLAARSEKLSEVCDKWLAEKEKMTEELYALMEGHDLVGETKHSSLDKASGSRFDRYICVRIWLPHYTAENGRVGHASLEIVDRSKPQPLTYISFWPSATPRTPVSHVTSKLNTHEDDIASEYDQMADIVVNLYTLAVNNIKTDHLSNIPYQLTASLWNSKAGNCVSVVYDLLKQAKLYERIPNLPTPKMLTPASLGEIVLLAKEKEGTRALDEQVIENQLLACLNSQNYADALANQPAEFQRLYTADLLAKVRAFSIQGDRKGFNYFINTLTLPSNDNRLEQIKTRLKPTLTQLFEASIAEYNHKRIQAFEALLTAKDFDKLRKGILENQTKENPLPGELLSVYNQHYKNHLGLSPALDTSLQSAWIKLKEAMESGDVASTSILLKEYPLLWTQGIYNEMYTAFHYACEQNNRLIFNVFLEQLSHNLELMQQVKALPQPLGWQPKQLNERLLGLCQRSQNSNQESVLEKVEEMLALGANHEAIVSRSQKRALHYAAENNNKALVELLLKHGADVQLTTDLGDTPLHLLAKHPQADVSIAELLIAVGINPSQRNKAYDTAKDIAVKNQQPALVQKLQEIVASQCQQTNSSPQAELLYRGVFASHNQSAQNAQANYSLSI